MKYSPSGKYLAVGSHDNAIYVYEVSKGYEFYCKFESTIHLLSHLIGLLTHHTSNLFVEHMRNSISMLQLRSMTHLEFQIPRTCNGRHSRPKLVGM